MATSFQRDPSQTILLRAAFERDFNKRFRLIEKDIVKLVVTEDAFGLGPKNDGGLSQFLTSNAGRWQFLSNPDKVSSFKKWFRGLVEKHLVTVEDANETEPWLATYLKSAYKSGVVKSFIAAKKKLGAIAGDKETFIRQAFDAPEAISKVKLVYTRAYDQLKGITSAMDSKISRVLGQALVEGRGPRQVAKTLLDEVTKLGKNRSRVLARTEIIHAHAEGQLDSLERLGIDKVETQVEWLTASNPCPLCAARSGEILTISEARGLIPYHPNCRCAWAPYIPLFDKNKPKSSPAKTVDTTIAKRYQDKKVSAKAVRDKMRSVGISQNNVHRLVGAPGGSSVSLALNEDGHLVVDVKGKDETAGDYSFTRLIKDKTTVENVSISVENKGTGFGSRVFVDQVQELQKRGFKTIETFAARSKTYVGYNIWPKMGYDGPIPETVAALRGNPPPGGATLISELMKTAEGRAWWQENGRGVDLTFDLGKKSQGVKVLKAYAKQKGYTWPSKNPTSNLGMMNFLTASGTISTPNRNSSNAKRPRSLASVWHQRLSRLRSFGASPKGIATNQRGRTAQCQGHRHA